ncbi:hypothetical protein [Tessaracoccus flavus]|uniref:Uncharacterized protein n=1 Tax=Tessaracoccus flavus TaxID=1610493 RepID=A0A1Q2CGK7_9ACTN|nr:hypothetical protein [Tessaracoccus flavus]AQP45246.1 hypothetical protein RPIT_10935 [Tessaracoccus flavus]SDY51544.1 hypothetical protein SAMN05428934_102116 [Tessaracoccus flavus]
MKLAPRLAALAAAAAIAFTGLTTQSARAADADVYTTPGGHLVNGRLWKTDCEMYSSNVVRCRTEIYAKTVVRQGGSYTTAYRWAFNNLTYLPSHRSQWADNPLAKTGTFTSQGRQWRTECDTPATGSGACRSYIKTTFVAYEGGKYVTKNEFVFNNLVRFAQGSIAPVTTIPAHVIDQSRLDFNGLGPVKIGTKFSDLGLLGYADYVTSDVCEPRWRVSNFLKTRGIDPSDGDRNSSVWYVSLTKPGAKTVAGAEVGMTVGQIKALYGSSFTVVPKTNYGETQYFGSVRDGGRELLFRAAGAGGSYAPDRALVNSDVIVEIRAWNFADDVSYDSC